VVGDGTGHAISNIGKTVLHTPNHSFHLSNVLHVPKISQKLLSVSSLCDTNSISIEFFSDCFLIKDLKTRVPILRGRHSNGLYHMPHPPTTPLALTTTTSILPPWHHILGHPADRIMRHLLPSYKIKSHLEPCISCNSVKSHKLPFSVSSITTKKPLELIYTDVWGPSHIKSIDGFSYYLVFVDHFTKYVWLYPLRNKSDVSTLFPTFKNLVENYFNNKIISLYSDNGGEFLKLKSFLNIHGISHLTTPPYTPELNAPSERRHRHIVETGRALLRMAKLPPEYWSFAFKTAVYLINRQPTPILKMQSPFQAIHKKTPNVSHLHSFGCLCFPWLRPYVTNKLQPRSQPCIFVGYADSQYSYLCLDPISKKIYTSRHVKFYDHIFPYNQLTHLNQLPSLTTTNISQPLHTTIPIFTHDHPLSHAMPHEDEVPMSSNVESGNDLSAPPLVSTTITTTNPIAAPAPINEPNQVITRSKNNIFKPKKMYIASKHPLPENLEPSNIREAMKHAH